MLYLNTKAEKAVLYIPYNGWPYDGEELGLTIRNTTDKREVPLIILDTAPAGFLVRVQVDVPAGLIAGEWEYLLTNEEKPIGQGLLMTYEGEKPGPVQYQTETNIIQYGG